MLSTYNVCSVQCRVVVCTVFRCKYMSTYAYRKIEHLFMHRVQESEEIAGI